MNTDAEIASQADARIAELEAENVKLAETIVSQQMEIDQLEKAIDPKDGE